MSSHVHMSEYDDDAIKIISFPAPPPKHPSPVGNTDVIIILVSVAVVAVVIIVAIVVSFTTAMIIVIKYKHLKLTTNPTQSDGPQEPPSSRCVRESGSVSSMNPKLNIVYCNFSLCQQFNYSKLYLCNKDDL